MDHPFQMEAVTAQNLARRAGGMAQNFKAASNYSLKPNNEGPVSEADIKADLIISAGLRSQFPNDLIISEETAHEDTFLPSTGRVWLVDPIDGTSDYVMGGKDYSVMIGLLVDGIPVLGVVYGPESDDMWIGVLWKQNGTEFSFAERKTKGANPVALNIRCSPQISEAPIVAASKNHPSKIADSIISSLNPSQIIRKGSLGLKIGLIVDGQADLYVAASRRIKVWDTCAPFAILKAAGGSAFTFEGKDLVFGPTCTHNSPFFAVSHRFAVCAIKKLPVHELY